MPRRTNALKDRGSTENSVGSDPSGGSDEMGYNQYGGNSRAGGGGAMNPKPSPSPALLKGGSGSHGKNLNKVGTSNQPVPASASKSSQPAKEMRSPDGRHTPVREHNRNLEVSVASSSKQF